MQIQTPELLQIINQAIVNLVSIVEIFGLNLFYLLLLIFAVWVVWNIGAFLYETLYFK